MFLIALAAAAAIASMPADAGSCVPRREAVVVALPGFVSPAEIVRPPAAVATRGLLVLFPGSDVADMDGAIVGAGDRIVSRPLRQVAGRMACAGFASLRYNKRHVTGATTVDREKFDVLTGPDLAADGRAALVLARSQPGLKELPVGLVGWSEGTTVAMAVAGAEPVVRAVVLMAPVVDSPARVSQVQYGRIGKPYLERYAANGSLDAEAIDRADAGPGGVLAHIFVRMFRGFRPEERINPLLDTNKDGRISFSEADPIIASWYADGPNSGLGMSATGRALPGIAAALTATTPPLLILQGLNDSMIGPESAQNLAAQPGMRRRIDIRTYNDLGHALGPAASAEQDGLLPVAQQPLNDMADWLANELPR